MRDQYDAIVIGAGGIGAATAFEFAKLGYRTLSVDRNPAASYGPTSNSCAIIRVCYSTFDGIAFAWEAYRYWKEWAEYLERPPGPCGTDSGSRASGYRPAFAALPTSTTSPMTGSRIYDKSRVPGFCMAIGSSGNQLKNAPVAGKMMAALIDYCEQGNDHDVDPLSFRLEHIGREVNAGFCSRKREINLESSFTVLG